MAVDVYLIERAAEEFWTLAHQAPSYPVELEEAIGWALPLEIRRAPGLWIRDVHHWAERAGIPYRFAGRDRRLRGCLIAYRDNGVVFLDGADPADEQRFTLAHELAHFLLDYRMPRHRALDALSESIRAVLDGQRPPTMGERMQAVLADAPLGVLSHVMERPDAGLPAAMVLAIEDRADRLALELLAPASRVLERLHHASLPRPYTRRLTHLSTILTAEYGLPTEIAASYARILLRRDGGPSVRDWLLGTAE